MKINTKVEDFKTKISESVRPIGSFDTLSVQTFTDMTCDGIKEVLEIGGMLIDVRTPKEYNSTKLHNSRNIPLMHLVMYLESVDRSTPILLYSTNGSRSEAAKNKLLERDFLNVSNIGKLSNFPFCS
jgi:rhodanese-related sulfurtransferase